MGPILVFGHKNPDNDSICSAVAYAHLKNLTDPEQRLRPGAARPGAERDAWVFERFGVELPEEIAHVRTRVRDVMTPDPVTIAAERADARRPAGSCASAACAGCRSSTPRVARSGSSASASSPSATSHETEIAGFQRMPVTVEQLVRVLDGELVAGDPAARISGDVLVGAAEPSTLVARVQRGRHAHRRRPPAHAADGARGRRRVSDLDRRLPARTTTSSRSRARARRGAHRHAARHLLGGAARLARARGRRPDGHRRAHRRARDAAFRGCRGPHREPAPRGGRRRRCTVVSSASSRARTSREARVAASCSSTTTRPRSRRSASRTRRWSRSSTTTVSATCRRPGRSCS